MTRDLNGIEKIIYASKTVESELKYPERVYHVYQCVGYSGQPLQEDWSLIGQELLRKRYDDIVTEYDEVKEFVRSR